MARPNANQWLVYVGVPAVVGFVLGCDRAGIGAFLPWQFSVLFWTATSLSAWGMFHLGALTVAAVLRPWTRSVPVIVVLGMLIASIPARSVISFYVRMLEPAMLHGRVARPLPELRADMDFLVSYLLTWGGVFALWIAVNLGLAPLLGLRPYAATKAPASPSTEARVVAEHGLSQQPPFLERLPRHLAGALIALKAEDHYLRIYTDRGEGLVLYRLSDAIAELERIGRVGVRTHRSWWASRDQVAAVQSSGRGQALTMTSGLVVPVSQTYRETVRTAFVQRSADVTALA